MSTITTFELKMKILSAGYTGFHFCDFESRDDITVEHFSLLQPGEKPYEGCIDKNATPLISKAGDSLLESYILGQVVIHPDPRSL
jgi:hypothetical protein